MDIFCYIRAQIDLTLPHSTHLLPLCITVGLNPKPIKLIWNCPLLSHLKSNYALMHCLFPPFSWMLSHSSLFEVSWPTFFRLSALASNTVKACLACRISSILNTVLLKPHGPRLHNKRLSSRLSHLFVRWGESLGLPIASLVVRYPISSPQSDDSDGRLMMAAWLDSWGSLCVPLWHKYTV